MPTLKEIDGLEIFVLMDNVSDPFTKNDTTVYWNESQYRHGVRKQTQLCGADYCRACNGLSLFIRIKINNKIHTILFDTGPDKGLVVDNAARLGLDLQDVEAIVLSHGHFDHYGGTLSVLKAINKKNLPVYTHPELFLPRAFGVKDFVYISDNLTVEKVEEQGGKVVESAGPITLLDDHALVSGEVARTTPYELGVPDEHRLKENTWECAPDVIDERCLIFNLKGKGIGVITGCGHTGIINATQHASALLNTQKIHFVMGGFHLASPELADRVAPTLTDLAKINPTYIVTGHCTGRHTQAALTHQFKNKHIPYGVGAVLRF